MNKTTKSAKPAPKKLKEPMLFLRTCSPKGVSRNGFVWPLKVGAKVTAPDWDPRPECGNGLHGLKDGQGDANLMDWSKDAVWIVFSSPDGVDLCGIWKVKTATICAVGDRKTATDFLIAAGRIGVHGSTATAGDGGTATAGYRGTATAGDGGTATAGDGGTATAGYRGTATAGYRGTATAGYRGTATAGDRGSLIIYWWDGNRRRVEVAYVGENGIKPNIKYRLNDEHKFEEVKV